MNDELVVMTGKKIADVTGYSVEELAIIKKNILKGGTDNELAYFAKIAASSGLNPFMKEIWGYKDNRQNLIIFAGRDGMLKRAQEQAAYNGLRSCEVRANDEFEMDIPNGLIHHKVKSVTNESRGEILGAYCFVFRKDGEPTIEFADFNTYNKGYNAWKTHPAAMIKKVAETNALKKSFGISGIQSEFEFNVNSKGIAMPIDNERGPLSELEQVVIEIKEIQDLELLDDKLEDWEHLVNNSVFSNAYKKRYNELEAAI